MARAGLLKNSISPSVLRSQFEEKPFLKKDDEIFVFKKALML